MKTIFIILICVACLIPILIGGGFGLGRIFENHCTNDTDCARSEKCSNNKCISACDGVSCGSEGHCEINNDHNSSCICVPDKYFDPIIKECGTYVTTLGASISKSTKLLNGKRYFYFYMHGNGRLHFYPEKKNKVLFKMEIKTSSFEASEGGNLSSFKLPSNVSHSDKKRGFWFRWDESTMNFGTIENNTTLHSYSIRNGSEIYRINLSSRKATFYTVISRSQLYNYSNAFNNVYEHTINRLQDNFN
ncbi:hypothetical protein PV328_002135 [Microctonus aethiopoides]|uniref:EGF-like domain-containing protein n=1 Tax=Microctonus aethiopoides TaxID=144406 RepID=A0AA39FYN4_9HYME|nr:hypothetical protein PV328_002135 [Microctonus aethiopoides]